MYSDAIEVGKFLGRFKTSSDIKEVFSSGCCYWFAAILFGRFIRSGAKIMYDEVANHFGTNVGGRVYDITGDVTNSYKWEPWDSITDKSRRDRILKESVMF